MMKGIFFSVLLSLFSNAAFSNMVMTGTITGMKLASADNKAAFHDPQKYPFPLSYYDVKSFFVCNLKYTDKTSLSDRKIDLNKFKCIMADGRMDLISYDKKSGAFKYKLLITPSSMDNNQANSLQYFSVKGKVANYDGKDYLPIKGKVHFTDNKPALAKLFKKDGHYFNLAFDHKDSYNITLIRLKDIPVTVEIDSFDNDVKY